MELKIINQKDGYIKTNYFNQILLQKHIFIKMNFKHYFTRVRKQNPYLKFSPC